MKMAHEELTDGELVAEVVRGNRAAFEVLFERHYEMIYRLSYRMIGSAADAQEIAQESFVSAARNLKGFKGGSSFQTWLVSIALNGAKNFHRSEERRKRKLAAFAQEPITSEDSDELSKKILDALDNLSTKEREAIVLTVYQEMSHKEAAKALKCAETTISWRVFMARKKLAVLLKAGG